MSGEPSAPVVDVHAHVLLTEVEDEVSGAPGLRAQLELDLLRQGAESSAVSGRMVAERMHRLTDLDARRRDMDAAGVHAQLLSPSPSQYHYWAEPGPAWTVALAANRGVAATVAADPARFHGLGLVPLQHPELAAAALDDALDRGLAGVEISSHAPRPDGGTVELSDPRLEPFWQRAARRGAVIFLHPFGCTLGARLDRFNLANTVGQPVENAVALSHLIFSGVLDRHPELRVLAAHGGGYLPTYLGRSDHAWQVRPDARECAHPPSSYLRGLWFDSLVHTPEALRALVAAVGSDRVLLGSDHPFDMGVTDPVDRLAAAELSAADQHAISTGNAELLGLAPRVGRDRNKQ
ncbi:amidohydrolase family protein [Actinopolyspora halophila]|uniref:amidohydrolase family protein n=1 Tax=Actinopolyspora halophila TaxID=1850 RepID=UPI0003727D3C|nr:amidohydrolase family protein [Actinopolyspora halophila]